MHEASAVEALVKIVAAEARAHGAQRIRRIDLVVGETTGYMEESLAFYLRILGKGTPAEGAGLSIRYVKSLLRCPACGKDFERSRFSFDCPDCGEPGVMTKAGSEFYIDSIEVEEAAP
jgi:hydrogenase nickel incorporation protein HypA/HybF